MKSGALLYEAVKTQGGRVLAYDEHEGGASWGGSALLKCDVSGFKLFIVFAADLGWDHVSAHVRGPKGPARIPSYNEMKKIKRTFFNPDETAMELHVPEADHIDRNPHVLHLWRPHDQEIPRPPEWMV